MTDAEPAPAYQRTRHVLGDESLSWAIIGASARASRRVIPAIRMQPPLADAGVRYPVTNSHVVGIFSHDVARARRFADENQLPHVFVNLADLLDRRDIQCVYVGGHPRHHAQATLAALTSGKHVLCETPMALSLEDATAMTHTAASAGLILGVNYSLRADPAIQAMRQMLIDREIGDVLGGRVANMGLLDLSLHTWRLQANGGGVVFNRTVHDIDLVRYLLRDEVASVYARSTQHVLTNRLEEDVVAHVELRRSPRIIELHDSFLVPHNDSRIELYGSAGTLVALHWSEDDRQSELLLLRNQRQTRLPVHDVDADQESVARFNDAVRRQGQPLAGSGDGVNNLCAVLAILESIQTGQRVAVPPTSRPRDDRSVM